MDVIIAGGGRVGRFLAAMLIARGDRVRIVERRPTLLAELARQLPDDAVVAGSAADPAVLGAAGARTAQVVAAVTDADEANLVIASLARFEFGVPRTIARVNESSHAWLFTPDMGVDVALDQADIIGRLIAEEMSLGDMMTLLKLRKGLYSLVEEKVDPSSIAAGRALSTLDLPDECALAAIIRKGDLLIPHADTVLQPADEVLAVVHADALGRLSALLGPAPSGEANPATEDPSGST
jgi:trk/ktr system potassium uptake protein